MSSESMLEERRFVLGNVFPTRIDDFYNFNLRTARIGLGYTVRDVALISGVRLSTYSAIEHLRMFPLEEIAEKIAGAVEKSVEFLFPDKLREVVARLREERNVGRLTSVEDRAGETYTSEGNEFRVPNVIGYNGWQGIEGNTFRTPVEVAEKGEIEERINGVLGILDPREREILKLRFGIHYGRSYTLEEVGKVLEVSRERIRQIEVKAMWRLRHPENGGRILEELSL